MDFLPYPDDPAQAGIEVPFFCTDANLARYVPPEAFSVDFPSSIIDYLFLKMAESNDMLEIAVLAQAGIYLRVLRELVGESFDVRDFVTTGTLDPGLRVITLRRLNESCGWSKKWLFDRDKVFQQLLQDLFRGNQHATSAFFQCVALLETFEPPCWTIGFSIWALLWSVSPRRTSRFYEFRRRTGAQWPEHRLIGAGWCPYWTRVYAQKLSPIQLYYMSGIPHVRHAGHGECPPAGPCTVYDVEYATYQTKHATSCSKTDCAFRGVDGRRLDDLSSIISRGGIPLIRLRPRDDSPSAHIDIEVVEHAYGKPYIAISHVWSGGLGNFSENTLPQCQLDFLYRSARSCRQKLYGAKANKHDISYGNRDGGRDLTETTDWLEGDISLLPLYYGLKGWFWLQNALERVVLGATGEDTSTIYLWIDTLCIPANPAPDEKRLQRKAIDSMALVYSMAMQVLVIDQSVRELSVQTETGLSLAAELMSCPWMTRSWTYQEGSLSRQTTFLLMDGWVNPKHLSLLNAGGVVRKPPRTFVKALMREFLDGLNDMPDLLNRSVHGSSPQEPALFVQIWNDLASRRTSIPDDLHGLLAVLLGLSAQEILDPQMRSHKSDAGEDKRVPAYDDQKTRSSAERMLAVYLSQASLPLSMIFTSFPPNTPMCNNNDWMPRFPTGSLDLEFGTMRWDCSGLDKIGGLSFSLRNSNLEAVMTQSSVETLNGTIFSSPSLLRTTHLPNNEKGVNTISVFLNPNSLENLRRVPAGSTLCILIHARTNLGACCFLSDKENDVDARMRLNFICPLTWELQSTTRGIQSNAGGDIVDLEPGSIITDRICVLSCDTPDGLKPRYRRPIAESLQGSLRIPIGITIGVVWAYAAVSLYRDPCWSHVDPLKGTPLMQWMATIPGLSWYYKFTQMVMPHARITMSSAFFRGRRALYYLIDVPRLEAVAERVRYERLAKSLDKISVEDLEATEQPTRLDIEPSYQFPRRWLIWIPIGCALYGLAGLPLMARYLLSRSWIYGWETAMGRTIFNGVATELVGRIVVEWGWRYFRLDLPRRNR